MSSERTIIQWVSEDNIRSQIETFLRAMSAINDDEEVTYLHLGNQSGDGAYQVEYKLRKREEVLN
jgi:hypothetical protein